MCHILAQRSAHPLICKPDNTVPFERVQDGGATTLEYIHRVLETSYCDSAEFSFHGVGREGGMPVQCLPVNLLVHVLCSQGRASTVEQFTKLVDRVSSTAFSDFRSTTLPTSQLYTLGLWGILPPASSLLHALTLALDIRSQLSKASLEEKKDAMIAERNRSHLNPATLVSMGRYGAPH